MNIAVSKNGVPIRLTDERWQHITIGHPDIADFYYEILEAIEEPEIIYEGNKNTKIAVKEFHERSDKFIVAVYKETSANDGFVITAHFTNKKQEFQKKNILWKQQQ